MIDSNQPRESFETEPKRSSIELFTWANESLCFEEPSRYLRSGRCICIGTLYCYKFSEQNLQKIMVFAKCFHPVPI